MSFTVLELKCLVILIQCLRQLYINLYSSDNDSSTVMIRDKKETKEKKTMQR